MCQKRKVTGRGRAPPYWHKPRASITKREHPKLPCAPGFFRKNVTGRVRALAYWYNPCASISKRERQKLPCASGFFRKSDTGRVRETTYWYTPGASLIKHRSRGFSWLCWDGAASEWPCSQSGESVPGSRRKSDPLLPGCGCVHRTYQSASATHPPLAR